MVVECFSCEVTIEGIEIAKYSVEFTDDPIDTMQYAFLKCPKCFHPILVKQKMEALGSNLYFGLPIQIYPNNEFHLNPYVPKKLQEALMESIKCFKTGAFTATAIMCRRAIEGFCTLKGINERNLASSIKKLQEDGVINDQLFEWANELRISGNKAAHEIDTTFSSIDARDILDFTIAIFDFSYSFKEKFNAFKERRNTV